MQALAVTIFPNYAARQVGPSVWLEGCHPALLEALCSAGVATVVAAAVCSSLNGSDYLAETGPGVQFMSLGLVDCSAPKWCRLFTYLPQSVRIARAVRLSGFCYIFAPGHVGLLAALCCWALQRRYGLYLRGDWKAGTPRALHSLKQRLYGNAEFIICTGNSLRDAVRAHNANTEAVVPMSEILCMPCSKASHICGDAAITILFVGTLVREKGVFELFEAFLSLRRVVGSDARLVYVGGGLQLPELRRMIQYEGVEAAVQCVGPVQDASLLAYFYGHADIFCLPTYSEGFPRVIYEAMKFSLPIVTTCVGQIPTVIRDECNGLLCPPRSVGCLTNQLERLVASAVLRARLGSAAYESLQPLLVQWHGQTHGDQVVGWLERTFSKSQ